MKNSFLALVIAAAAVNFVSPAHAFVPRVSIKQVPAKKLATNILYQGSEVSETGETWKSTVQIVLSDDTSSFSCTGTLFQSNVIVTAAHCVRGFKELKYIQVNFFKGSTPVDAKSFDSTEFKAIDNPSYRGSGMTPSHDMAVIVFKDPIIDDDGPYHTMDVVYQGIDSASSIGSKVYISGAGSIDPNSEYNENLNLYFATGIIQDYVGGDALHIIMNRPYAVCGGDSGSPVTVKVDGVYYLAGVLSSGSSEVGSCGREIYAAYMTADDYDWLQTNIESANTLLQAE